MIFFGTTGLTSITKTADYFCPQCEEKQSFKHKKITKFFTLYFVPLIPLGEKGRYVECGNCKGTFFPDDVELFNANVENHIQIWAIYEEAIRHCMVLIMLADGRIDHYEKMQVHKIINDATSHKMSLDELDEYIEQVKKENHDVTRYLRDIGPTISEVERESIIRNALKVAAADGNVDDNELKLIAKMSNSVSMTKGRFQEIVNESVQLD